MVSQPVGVYVSDLRRLGRGANFSKGFLRWETPFEEVACHVQTTSSRNLGLLQERLLFLHVSIRPARAP